jgi:hypothetical protein
MSIYPSPYPDHKDLIEMRDIIGGIDRFSNMAGAINENDEGRSAINPTFFNDRDAKAAYIKFVGEVMQSIWRNPEVSSPPETIDAARRELLELGDPDRFATLVYCAIDMGSLITLLLIQDASLDIFSCAPFYKLEETSPKSENASPGYRIVGRVSLIEFANIKRQYADDPEIPTKIVRFLEHLGGAGTAGGSYLRKSRRSGRKSTRKSRRSGRKSARKSRRSGRKSARNSRRKSGK